MNTEPTFIPKKRGRSKTDPLEEWQRAAQLNDVLREYKEDGFTLDGSLREAAIRLPMSFEALRKLYYSDLFEEMQDAGEYVTF